MKKGLLIVLLLQFPFYGIQAQDGLAKNGTYLELLGNGGVFSVNYERFLTSDFSIRAGFASYTGETWWEELWGNKETTLTTFPILGNYFLGNGRNRLELGGGVLLGTKKVEYTGEDDSDRTSTIFDLTAVVGYRYQDPYGGIILRAGLTPFLALSSGEDAYPNEGFTISGGVSVGYAF